uniref:Ig-like domain-containing protein n=1 Tax=Chrysemys picta bellii TaxID=8478 RepID=A0A8C3HV02_CHRPI
MGLGGCPGLVLTVCLLCADPNLPRPSISLSPTGVTPLGADVTIRCQGQRRDVSFFLHKTGDLNPQRHMDPAGDRAEFRIPTVGRQHGGSYSCSYRPRSEPFVSSEPSDTVELVVVGEGPGSTSPLPAGPSKVRHPNGMLRARLLSNPPSFFSSAAEGRVGWVPGSGSHSLSPVRRSQFTQTLHFSEPHWGHRPRGRCHHPVSGAAPGHEVLPAQGWRPKPTATHGPCWGWGRVPHPHREPPGWWELQLQLPAPIRALRLLAAQRPGAAGGSR